MINNFSRNEIVCLKHQHKSLYCEVIDIIKIRSMGWFRPIMLIDSPDNFYFNEHPKGEIYDLRFSSDLLWHLSVFLPVLDTEYLTFFSKLEEFNWNEQKYHLARQKLRSFLEEIYLQKP